MRVVAHDLELGDVWQCGRIAAYRSIEDDIQVDLRNIESRAENASGLRSAKLEDEFARTSVRTNV
jgi:hypothetical protein